ncbi:hypothetical protein SDJN03_06440, partial [Cucurbita argyrosperma subsp. sororia]
MTMLGFLTIPYQWKISPSLPSSSSPFSLSTRSSFSFPLFKFPLHYSESQIPGKRKRFTALASNNDNGLGGNIKEREGERNGAKGSNGDDDLRKERGPVFNIKWAELLIDPDPDNILAVALTGLLAWASVQPDHSQACSFRQGALDPFVRCNFQLFTIHILTTDDQMLGTSGDEYQLSR